MGALGFRKWQTGGGCEAFGRINPFDGSHCLVTVIDGGEIPTHLEDEIALGVYESDDDGTIGGSEGEIEFEGVLSVFLAEEEARAAAGGVYGRSEAPCVGCGATCLPVENEEARCEACVPAEVSR